MPSLETFKLLGLSNEILLSIGKHGFTGPTAIQSTALPKIFAGCDLIVEAQTGSGKTACFAWPLLQKLSGKKPIGAGAASALILTPTRELALQVSESLSQFGKFLSKKVSVLTIIGGESIEQQTLVLNKGVNIVVATPGRLLDLIAQKLLYLGDIEFFVLDEADKILDLGFAAELDMILQNISVVRQNLFFSATYPEKVLDMVKKISRAPEFIKIDDVAPTVESISQRVIQVNKDKRGMLLRHLITTEKWRDGLVFVSSKTAARNLCQKLRKAGVNAGAIHGDLTQPERNKALSDFKGKKIDFLIATDVAARGLDINNLSLVINFDLPRSPADYIHRIGRTGRAGATGLAISFIGHEDQQHFNLIEKRAQVKLVREDIAGFELTGEAPLKVKGTKAIKGKRKSKKDRLREQKLK